MATVAVLGGGVTGLSCAYYLKAFGGSKIKYLCLIERNPLFGGWIQTTRFPDGAIFEHGPRTLRVGTKAGFNAIQLAEELGLSNRMIPITRHHPVAKTNFILSKGQLHPIPRSLPDIFRKTPLFPRPLMSYLFKEYFTKKSILEDESVYDFACRRIGKDVADYAFDPMCRGISAGDARELSLRSMFPSMYEAEKEHGSVIKDIMIHSKLSAFSEFMASSLVQQAVKETWRMWTLKTGLTELIDSLACSIEEIGVSDLLFNSNCSQLTFSGDKAELLVDNEKIVVNHVFSCIPSQELAKLVSQYPVMTNQLESIPSVDVAVVYLEYQGNLLKTQGFGFLAPSFEDSKVLGIVFDSCCFPELNGENKTRLSCMLGGRWFGKIFGNSDSVKEEDILRVAIEEAGRLLNINESPVRHKVVLQKQCIPQYVIGHHKKLEVVDSEIAKNNLCLSLLGASYKGAGVPDCIYNAKLAVQNYLKSL
ncbi:protoporphyrinogen oxidase-like [Uloborus diversus]|uniref:protoporphyrinogen oxidase-like n=1 Tax=Uloborus diversus TaxID=327109 RepID=UPI0024093579|nr:protoporphyrinogen oxidase-like [Uloborus diversus]